MSFFDTHAHIYARKYKEDETDIKDILKRSAESGVDRILIPGDSKRTSILAVETAASYNGAEGITLYASVGVHPHEAKDYDDDTESYIRECLEHREERRVRAVGAICPRGMSKGLFSRGSS